MNEIPKNVCPYCSASFEKLEDLRAHVVSSHKTQPLPRSEEMVRMTVNGKT